MAAINQKNLNQLARSAIDAIGGQRLHAADVRVLPGACGSVILDFGMDRLGTLAGGRILAELCLAGLGQVSLAAQGGSIGPLPTVMVETDDPLWACIGSQYAGWPLSTADYFAMASGPARMLRGRESMLDRYQLQEIASQGVVILEGAKLPTETAVTLAGIDCQLPPSELTFCIARTSSLPGTIQIVARCIETAMHKLFELGFDLSRVVRAFGNCPLPPIGADDLQSIGWTNDAIIFGSDVTLWVDCDDAQIEAVLAELPSCRSRDFGRPFLETFEKYDRDFYKIDRLLFSPARVTFNNCRTGRLFVAGSLHEELFLRSLGLLPNGVD